MSQHSLVALWAVCPRYERPQLLGAWPDVRDSMPELLDSWMRLAAAVFLDHCPDGDPLWFDARDGRWAFATSGHVLDAPTLDPSELEHLREGFAL